MSCSALGSAAAPAILRGLLIYRPNWSRRAKWIINLKDATGELVPWKLRLSDLARDVVHCSGTRHKKTDAL